MTAAVVNASFMFRNLRPLHAALVASTPAPLLTCKPAMPARIPTSGARFSDAELYCGVIAEPQQESLEETQAVSRSPFEVRSACVFC